MPIEKIEPGAPESQSADLLAKNLAQLRALFPELVTEGVKGPAINVDVLKGLVGDITVTDADEKYGLNWHGKRAARQLALTPSTGTLRPFPEESVDWDSTQNLMIEGDNLEVLKLLQKSYAGKVKLIYIDPPYNTGQDFVYPDNFQDSIKNYLELTGQAEGGRRISSNTDASGRFHTDWLNMIYPRLQLARNLLRSDGVIFVSIGDREVHHLRDAMDEVFGPENFSATVIWEKADSPRNTARQFSEDHDFVLVYSKSPEWSPSKLPRTDEANSIYSNPDNDPIGKWIPGDPFANKPYSKGKYTIIGPTGRQFSPPPGRYWRVSEEKLRELDAEGRVWWGPKKDARPSIKRYLSEVADLTPRTLWKKEDVGSNRTSKNELRALFPESESFDTPKPTKLIDRMIRLATDSNEGDLILDFFAGSGTTGHAVYNANVEDGGNRRFVLVQLPEPLEQRSGELETIADITRERLRRAAKAQRDAQPLFGGDLGFRSFRLAESNIRAWTPSRDNLAGTLFDHIDHVDAGRSDDDVLYELLLKLGLDLCVPISVKEIVGKTVHSIGGGVLLACLDIQITAADSEPLALGIVAWHKALQTAGDVTCVFRDIAFVDDVAKTNLAAILEQHGVAKVRSL
ncbi:putative methyltransferase [Variovorax sp. SRS16]|uniref:site-specific DNA-methyltransferase n=1 Tax=Variovorax sp. SRS16 TaxID=282217 RepID=UPI0013197980|nr:site-specific DNA-methyltransferase [Variovorax sp. SRS16]VTU24974.1 putative methyltransferase [Variovorax sp. SRS16]